MQTFLTKCPHLQDLNLIHADFYYLDLSPSAELKSFHSADGSFRLPLFEYFPTLESLTTSLSEISRHSEEQLRLGLHHVKSLHLVWTSSFTLSSLKVLRVIASDCHLERLIVANMGPGHYNFGSILARQINGLISSSNWPQLTQLYIDGAISLEAFEDICDKFPFLGHLHVRLESAEMPNLACLIKLKALEEMRLSLKLSLMGLSLKSELKIREVFATGNSIFPLDGDGKDNLMTFPRARKLRLAYPYYPYYLVVRTNLGEVQRWIRSRKRNVALRIRPPHIIQHKLPKGHLDIFVPRI